MKGPGGALLSPYSLFPQQTTSLLVLRPQEMLFPTLTAMKLRGMTLLPVMPQQVIFPARRTQVLLSPALRAVKPPVRQEIGLSLCPLELSPQQTIAPVVRRPQVWKSPALTAVKRPASVRLCPLQLAPQQMISPVVRSPQA